MAIAPTPSALAAQPSADDERVIVVLRFGAGLQELIARCQLRTNIPATSTILNDRFAPDMSHILPPDTLLKKTLAELLELEPRVLGEPPSSQATDAMPSTTINIQKRIDDLLAAYKSSTDASKSSTDASPEFKALVSSTQEGIRSWDTSIVERIINESPAIINGYEVGKALSLQRWSIWEATSLSPANDNTLVVHSWARAFDKERIDSIQRRLGILSTVLDARAVTIVATSLGYWRHALLKLDQLKGGPHPQQQPRQPEPTAEGAISVSPEQRLVLLALLEEQYTNWLDLLTGRRLPESFHVTGIVTSLTTNLAANVWAKVYRNILPIAALILIGIAIVGAVVAILVVVPSGAPSGGGLLGSVGAALGGVITFLWSRGRGLFNRGTSTVNQLQERIDALEERATSTLHLPQVPWQDLGQNALSQVVQQIQLEELNLAVSEPLVRYILSLDGRDKQSDPLEEAKRFLEVSYGDKSNLARLLPVFEELYKYYWARAR
jgi:hypothetical protein